MMKYFKHFIFIGLVLPLFSQENALPGFYHTYEEIESQLNAWDEEFGNTPTGYGIIFHKEIIGYSTEENLPFWAVKISDNADVDEDEARILILGQCHAEEIYGVEISMALINCFLNTGIQECFSTTLATQVLQNLQNLEIWVVPTHNPEGLRVVHGYEETVDDSTQWIQDVSYRKNKRDVNNNGIFSFDNTVEAGSDSDGVDLNRNYDFNWIFGDDKFVEDCSGSYCSHFDYYRGEAPFSELENQAIRDFAIEKQFLVSIAYHSSRSGNVSEKVIYSWEWDETKFSPDFDVIDDIGEKLSNQIFKDAMDGSTYTPTTSKSRKGNAHDWFYKETGCIQYLIEVGTANMQSADSTHVYQIIEDNMNGAFYLLARARGNSNNADKFQVTGIVTAGNTGELVHAEVKILEMDGGVLKPRFTDSFGRFRRLLNEGNYTLKVSAQGFEDYEQSFYSSSSQVTEMNVVLDPLPTHNFTLELTVPDGIPSSLQLFRKTKLKTDTLNISENGNIFEWYEDYYTITILGEELTPSVFDLDITQDKNVSVTLFEQEIIWEDNFEDLDKWSHPILFWDASGVLRSQTDLTYDNSLESAIISSELIHVDEETNAVFELSLKYELEWDNDSLSLGINDINENRIFWLNHWTYQNWVEHTEYIPVTLEAGGNYFVVIRLKTDENVNYRGVEMESLTLMKGSTTELGIDSSIPIQFGLSQNHPNPFNAETKITFSLPSQEKINLTIYNLQGKMVNQLIREKQFEKGIYTIPFNAGHLSSGIYFYSVTSEGQSISRKMIILK